MPTSATNSQIITNMSRANAKWSGTTISYSFPTVAPQTPYNEEQGFSPLSEAQKAAARLSIQLWDDLIAPEFIETTGPSNIKFSNTTSDIGYAHAYYPGGNSYSGSVWFNPAYNSSWGTNDLLTPKIGQWGFNAYNHEIGHAIGLPHPGDYNGGDPTYAVDAAYTQDSQMYTIMSYFDAVNTGADWVASDGREYYAQTPMLHDIMAIQAIYGADTGTRAGNTTYGFNATSDITSSIDKAIFDFTLNKHPILSIWDGAGIDWLDLSGFATSSRIDLNQGAFSDCDGMTMNISIAYNCDIENAAGGAGNDSITGNALNNILVGNGGNDTLRGGGGADTLLGGDGDDTFYADIFDDLTTFNGGNGIDILYIIATVEQYAAITFDYGAFFFEDMVRVDAVISAINGTEGADTLTGTANDDVINGLGGNDTLNGAGGADQMNGGNGNDSYVVDNAGDVVDETGVSGTDTVSSSISFSLADTTHAKGSIERLTLSGSAGINAIGNALANVITGNSGANILEGLGGADQLIGGGGSDTASYANATAGVTVSLTTSSGATGDATGDTFSSIENISGSGQNDTISGNAGANVLNGGNGIDTVSYANATAAVTVNLSVTSAQNTVGAGTDTIFNFEKLTGSSYNDTLTGSSGDNVLSGLGGADRLNGGAGMDTLIGGAGADRFIFTNIAHTAVGANRDLISDFVRGSDKIDLSAIDARSATTTNEAFSFIGTGAFNGVAGQLHSFVSNGQTIVEGDVNGDRVADFQIALTGSFNFSSADFIL